MRRTPSQFTIHTQQQTISFGNNETYLLTSSPVRKNIDLELQDVPYDGRHPPLWQEEERVLPADLPPPTKGKKGKKVELTEGNLSVHNVRMSNVNPMISNFTSPIGWSISPFVVKKRADTDF